MRVERKHHSGGEMVAAGDQHGCAGFQKRQKDGLRVGRPSVIHDNHAEILDRDRGDHGREAGRARFEPPRPLAPRSRARLENIRVHDLCHSFASRALALGESLTMNGKLLGHNKIDTTSRAHLRRDSIKASSARVADSIGADILNAKPRKSAPLARVPG